MTKKKNSDDETGFVEEGRRVYKTRRLQASLALRSEWAVGEEGPLCPFLTLSPPGSPSSLRQGNQAIKKKCVYIHIYNILLEYYAFRRR